MDMEKLNQTRDPSNPDKILNLKYQLGPYAIDGNNDFSIVFKDTSSFQIQAKFYQEPDSIGISLLADYEKKCEFSTFLDSGEILVKIIDRYLVFDNDGEFIYQVTFGDINSTEQEKQINIYNQLNPEQTMSNVNKGSNQFLKNLGNELVKKVKEKDRQ